MSGRKKVVPFPITPIESAAGYAEGLVELISREVSEEVAGLACGMILMGLAGTKARAIEVLDLLEAAQKKVAK